MQATIHATLESAEDLILAFRREVEGRTPRFERFTAELLLREAVGNAVVHGCNCDAGKQVHCAIRLRGSRLIIAVWDEGQGFDWRALWQRASQPDDVSGRGIEILRQFATRVRFSKKGNAITIARKFTGATHI